MGKQNITALPGKGGGKAGKGTGRRGVAPKPTVKSGGTTVKLGSMAPKARASKR